MTIILNDSFIMTLGLLVIFVFYDWNTSLNSIIYLKFFFNDMTIGSIVTWLSIPNMYQVQYMMNWKHGFNVRVSPKKIKFKSTIEASLGLSNDIGDKKLVKSCFVMKCKLSDAPPNSFTNSNVNLKWKQWKSKESRHVPWLVALWG
jgi:hypothetical protein